MLRNILQKTQTISQKYFKRPQVQLPLQFYYTFSSQLKQSNKTLTQLDQKLQSFLRDKRHREAINTLIEKIKELGKWRGEQWELQNLNSLRQMARLYAETNNLQSSLSTFEQALKFAEDYSLQDQRAGVLEDLAETHFNLQNFSQARFYFEQILQQDTSTEVTLQNAIVLSNIASTYTSESAFVDALDCYQRAENLLRPLALQALKTEQNEQKDQEKKSANSASSDLQTDDSQDQGYARAACQHLIVVKRQNAHLKSAQEGLFQQAEQDFVEAVELSAKLYDARSLKIVQPLIDLAVFYQQSSVAEQQKPGNQNAFKALHEKALKILHHALQILENSGADEPELAESGALRVLNAIAKSYQEIGDFSSALDALQRVEKIIKFIRHSKQMIAMLKAQKGFLFIQKNELKEAETEIRDGLEMARDLPGIQAALYCQLAYVELKGTSANSQSAYDHAKQAMEVFLQENAIQGRNETGNIADCLRIMGLACFALGKKQEGKRHLQEALSIFKKLPDRTEDALKVTQELQQELNSEK